MIIIFFITGTMGLFLAFGYSNSGSLYIPISIHLGWNFTQQFIFSSGNIGNGLFMLQSRPQVTVSMFIYYLIQFFPVLSAFRINYILISKRKNFPLATTTTTNRSH